MNTESEGNGRNNISGVTESTPLLQHDASPENDAEQGRKTTTTVQTPVPWRQILTLCAVRIVDPIAFSQILPYINDMLRDMHVTDDPARIGFYSGLTESAFSLAVMLAIYPWARVSDHVGRKPVLLSGTIGVALATLSFMLALNFPWIVVSRFVAGLCSGNSAAVHSIVGEMVDDSNAAQVYPIYGLSFPLGTTIGAFIGGTFAYAPLKWPFIFRGSFFKTYPYAVPSLISACFTFTSVIFGAIYLEETHPDKTKANLRKTANSDITIVRSLEPPPSALTLIRIPRIRSLTISGFFLCFLSSSFDIVFTLFAFTPIPLGGLGFRPFRIGLAISISGIMGGLLSVLGMPRILRRWSPGVVYWFAMGFWPLAFAIMPVLNTISRWKLELTMMPEDPVVSVPSAESDPAVWIGIVIALAASKIGCMAYGCNMLLVRTSAPAPNALGSTNGVVHLSINFARAISPALTSSLFAFSTQHNILQGSLWAWVMVIIGFIGQYTTRVLRT
ncbi:hypothetical protein FRC19_004354 [Serendipita sp. 401]|nr:hypothetical protein FRC19_004354 [Serendipita sp. 401]